MHREHKFPELVLKLIPIAGFAAALNVAISALVELAVDDPGAAAGLQLVVVNHATACSTNPSSISCMCRWWQQQAPAKQNYGDITGKNCPFA